MSMPGNTVAVGSDPVEKGRCGGGRQDRGSVQRKGGKQIKQEVEDRSLSRVLQTLSALRGRRLFNAPNGNGTKRPITAREVNSFIAKAAGTDISAKDFRTFRASAAALASLTKRNGHDSKRSRAKAIVDAPTKRVKSSPIRGPSRDQATFIQASSKPTNREN